MSAPIALYNLVARLLHWFIGWHDAIFFATAGGRTFRVVATGRVLSRPLCLRPRANSFLHTTCVQFGGSALLGALFCPCGVPNTCFKSSHH